MRTSHSGRRLGKILVLSWAIVCILFFITLPGRASYIQWSDLGTWQILGAKLARLSPTIDLLNLVWSFIGILIFLTASISLGIFIMGKTKINGPTSPPTLLTGLALLATCFLVGQGVFGLIFLALGGMYQLTWVYVILLLLLGFLAGAGALRDKVKEVFSETPSALRQFWETHWDRTTILFSGSIIVLSLFYSTAQISYDSSALYFSNAKLTAMYNHLRFFTEDSFVVSAFHSSIQYTALIQVFGDQSARMLSWLYGLIFIILALATGEQTGLSRRGLIILLTLLLTSTAFLDLMGDGKVDLLSSAPALAAVYWMVLESQRVTPQKSLLLLIGFLIGLAIIGRPFNAFLLIVFTGLFYFQRLFLRKAFEPLTYKLFLRSLFSITAGAIGLGIYHLFANWIMLGHPLAFLSSISKINPSAGPWDYDPSQILSIRLLYPFVATFYNTPQTLGNISPLFVAFLPAWIIPDIRGKVGVSRQLYSLSIISLITLLLWIFLFFTVYEIRYVLFLWAILFMPMAEIIAAIINDGNPLLRKVVRTLILALLAFFIIRTLYISVDTYSPVDAHGNPQCFCESLDPINRAAASGDRILTLSAFRYYLRSDLFACSTKHEEYQELRNAAKTGTESFWREVYRQGYEYISFEVEYTTKHLEMGIIPSPENTPKWLALEPIYVGPGNAHMAYRIDVKSPPGNAEAACEMNTSGIWEVQYTR